MSSGQANAEINEDLGPTLSCLHEAPIVAHTLTGTMSDSSEDGTGRHAIAFNGRMDPVNGPVPGAIDTDPLTTCVAYSAMPMNSGKDFVVRETDVAQPLMAAGPGLGDQGGDYIAQGITIHGTDKTVSVASYTDVAGALRARAPGGQENSSTTAVQTGWAVRRLAPKECARLQGFPDDYLDITYNGKPAADGPRYKALGNSFAVNVVRWIGRRIQMVSELNAEAAE
jgi:DNA (cytosine-5)-methyltransferase 1